MFIYFHCNSISCINRGQQLADNYNYNMSRTQNKANVHLYSTFLFPLKNGENCEI